MQFTKNLDIIGAQSTRKTKLVSVLGSRFTRSNSQYPSDLAEPYQFKEVARNVLKEYSFTAHDITSAKAESLEPKRLIIQAQANVEIA